VVEQYDISEAQNLRGIRQLAGSGIAKPLVVVPQIMAPTMLTVCEAEK